MTKTTNTLLQIFLWIILVPVIFAIIIITVAATGGMGFIVFVVITAVVGLVLKDRYIKARKDGGW